MEEKLNGIVVSATDYRENDKIINVFTPERGVISASLKGVKKAGAKLKFAAAPFCLAEFMFSVKGDKRTVIGAALTDSFYPLREDLKKFYCGATALEFVKKFVREEMSSPELFILVVNTLKDLAYGKGDCLSVTSEFLVSALKFSGYALNIGGCLSCGKTEFTRVFFDVATGGFYCEECFGKEMREINPETYAAIVKAERGEPLSPRQSAFALRFLNYYVTAKTEETLNALKDLNRLTENV
ncbi:MAG: DNA repair protein RecO [Clostridia bacterium]|nr:DNA repair protein RecO [Clostridia bacterium]